jgi:predicted Rossmann fold nucleotide-binding protein DprA/Smf involved in DNA uptake
MTIGFTGTRKGMTPEQIARATELLSTLGATRVVHGCAVGADREFHALTKKLLVVMRPVFTEQVSWAYAIAGPGDTVIDNEPDPLLRNRAIVHGADVMLAAPSGTREEQRSGTWATIRYARKKEKHVIIVWPSGDCTEVNNGQ